jgi:hypothetical protein
LRERRLVSLFATAALLAGCKGTDPIVPTQIVVSPSGTVSFGTLNRTRQLAAAVVDQNGDTMTGRTFTWSSSSTAVATVSDSGLVTAKANGSARITVTSGGLEATVAVSVAQVAASIAMVSGDGQIANQSSGLAAPLTVLVRDSAGSAAAGVIVAFSVTAGGGSVGSASVTTGAAGQASTSWTLGSTAVSQTATAAGGTLPVLTFSASGIPLPAAGFQITVLNYGQPFSAAVQAAFTAAVSFWQTAITGDIPNLANFSSAQNDCEAAEPAMGPLTVDDVIILARIEAIDGVGGVLGQASPCYVRLEPTGGTPANRIATTITGVMRFDVDDVASLAAAGRLNDVIRHEVGHVLGFGPWWQATYASGTIAGFGCLQNPSSSGSNVDTYYACARGLVVFDSIGGTSYSGGSKVPLENCVGITGCGAGNYNSHWRESTFDNELMTGYLNSGAANPASALTLAAMQDLGFTVNLNAAESYSRTFAAPPAMAGASRIDLGNDVHIGRVFGAEARNGRVSRRVRLR